MRNRRRGGDLGQGWTGPAFQPFTTRRRTREGRPQCARREPLQPSGLLPRGNLRIPRARIQRPGTSRRSAGRTERTWPEPQLSPSGHPQSQPHLPPRPLQPVPWAHRCPLPFVRSLQETGRFGLPRLGTIKPTAPRHNPLVRNAAAARVRRWFGPGSRQGAGAASARGGGGCTRARSGPPSRACRWSLRWRAEVGTRVGAGRGLSQSRVGLLLLALPPPASRLGRGRDWLRPASSARRAVAAWRLQLPTGAAAGPGSERGQRARPAAADPARALLRAPVGFHGDSRQSQSPALGRAGARAPGERSGAGRPSPGRTPPESGDNADLPSQAGAAEAAEPAPSRAAPPAH